MKKALGNNKLTNKCQHLGENRAISKWQEMFLVAQGLMGEREAEGTDGRRRGRVSGPVEPVRGQSRGQEGADGPPEASLPGRGH